FGNLLREKGLEDLPRQKKDEHAFNQAVELYERLVNEFPRVPEYRRELAHCYGELGKMSLKDVRYQRPLEAKESYRKAEKSYREAVKHQEQLVKDFPQVPVYRESLAASLVGDPSRSDERDNLVYLLEHTGRLGEALVSCRQAVALRRQLADQF